MNLDVERELRIAMDEFTADVQAPPDLLHRLGTRRVQLPRLRVGIAAVAVAAVVVAILLVAEQLPARRSVAPIAPAPKPLSIYHATTDYVTPNTRANLELHAAMDHWGSTRGDLANNTALLQEVAAEWTHPTSHPAEVGAFDPVPSPSGALRILWVGSTPQGPAAFAVQSTRSGDYWYGILLPNNDGHLQLADRRPLDVGIDLSEMNPHVISFTTGPSHAVVVAIPYAGSDSVRMSFGFTNLANDQWRPQWQDVPVHDGAAVATVPAGGVVEAGVAEVRRGDTVVADHRIDFISPTRQNDSGRQPSNALGLWCNGCRAFGTAGTGWGMATQLAWVTRHAPSYVPVDVSEWSVGGRFDDGRSVLAWQMWVPGEAARTVVLQTESDGTTIEVLEDTITDPHQRPLVQIRLPNHEGWLVASGPDSVITGWRVPGGSWHKVAGKKSMLLPDERGMELRIGRG